MSMSIFLCFSALRISRKSHGRTSPIFVALIRSAFDGVSIRYVLPVLRVWTLYFHTVGSTVRRVYS